MKKKNKHTHLNYNDEPFVIHQIPNIEGLKTTKSSFKPEDVESPHFGKRVKTGDAVGIKTNVSGDQDKRHEDFRVTKTLSKADIVEKYGRENAEFIIRIKEQDIPGYTVEQENQDADNYDDNDNDYGYERPIPKPFDTKIMPDRSNGGSNTGAPAWLDGAIRGINVEIINDVNTSDEIDDLDQDLEDGETQSDNESASAYQTGDYVFPSKDIFAKSKRDANDKPQWLLNNIDIINQTFINHSVEAQVVNTVKGPTVTRYEVKPGSQVRVQKIAALEADLQLALSATSIRIEAPIPGKNLVGIEVPNSKVEVVAFGDVITSDEFYDSSKPLLVAAGEDIDGNKIILDIVSMTHCLVAGATGAGKSVFINALLVSLLLRNHPDDLKLILVDPKQVELSPYNDIPHLVTPVIVEAKVAAAALLWAEQEMDNRFRIFSSNRVRDVDAYNRIAFIDKMPRIVIVIDELADLMAVSANDVETSIQRLTSKARAAGIHLIFATQRPSTDVISGTIKNNIPARIAFRVPSHVDSMTILDSAGAEKLLGRGDMLYKGAQRTIRLQGVYISDDEINAVINHVIAQQDPKYLIRHDDLWDKISSKTTGASVDPLFEDVGYFVIDEGECSANKIMVNFNIGHNRVSRIITNLEDLGVVEGNVGTKARRIFMTRAEFTELLMRIRGF